LNSLRSTAPGLGAVGVATAVAFGVAHLLPAVNASTVAVVLGTLASNLGLHRPVLRPGTHIAAHRLLRIAVALLGLQLSVPQLLGLGLEGLAIVVTTVAITFIGTQLMGWALGLSRARSLLIAAGFSICGASAVAAMANVAEGDEDDAAVAIALVTLCGSLAIVLLPALRGPLALDPSDFGRWVGASVHDVGQTVATANRVNGSLTTAVLVKLSRVILLAPLVVGVSLLNRRRRIENRSTDSSSRRTPLVPLFVIGFLAAIGLTSTGLLPPGLLSVAKSLQQVLLVAALVGLGTGIHLPTLRRTGGRALILALASWLLVGATAYAGVILLRQ
jgi:uncharacterized integral membrane protein (TIGR00698 family)